MIINLFVAVDLAIALFGLAVGSYAAFKAYKIGESERTAASEERYELEKDFYLVSTVGWMTLGTRLLAIPLFWFTVLSLIPSVPGAMCEFGVFQAGAPWSWADLGLKLFTVFTFGGWLFFDFMNRRLKGSMFMGSVSRGFVLLMPILFIDASLDLVFFSSLQPLVVPCCMVVYSNTAVGLFNIGCPFCFITYQYPLLWGVLAVYAVSVGLIIWSFFFRRSSHNMSGVQKEILPSMRKVILISVILAVVGTMLLLTQIGLGSFSNV
ncbi:MAG: hypothetical protein QG670_1607 [Thermoproteota archaeon]|nr:hypothetical protein [Thermoproteota archaeon]